MKYFHLALAIFVLAVGASAQSAPPIIFFTDLTSGPNSGGESVSGFSGAYVTIYGDNFGATQGTSTITLNGANCLRVVSWGSSWLWYQKIVVQLGSSCTSGNFLVTVGGQPSVQATSALNPNPAQFTVRSGNIYCVSTSGNNANSGKFPSSCWHDLVYATSTVGAGDIIYALNGVNQPPGSGYYAATLPLTKTGTATNPIALVAYPGATVTVGTTTGDERGIFFCGPDYAAGCGTGGFYWTVAGITVRAVCEPFQMTGANQGRVIANDISAPNCEGSQSGDVMEGEPYFKLYGNYLHDTAVNTVNTVTKLHHAVYISDGDHAVDFAWNRIANNHSNRGVQVYSSYPNTQPIYDVHVHHNQIYNNRGAGIIFQQVDSTQGKNEAYNNLIYRAGIGPDFNDGYSAWQCIETDDNTTGYGTQVYNNTLYSCGYNGGGAPGGVLLSHFDTPTLSNNIMYQTPPFDYLQSNNGSGATCANNLFYGVGATPSGCTNGAKNSDPLFANLTGADFHLTSTSPAIDAGVTISSLRIDLDGIARPQGSGYDIGAYEFFTGQAASRPNPPTNLTVVVN